LKEHPAVKLLTFCKSKIHRATVTCCDINYVGSITIDENLMDACGLLDGEYVHVWNIDNGERFETYAIPGERGSGSICVNGAAARRCHAGDKVIIVAFVISDEKITRQVVLVDEDNRITQKL
jgi:aspartate 1-decarboxylase